MTNEEFDSIYYPKYDSVIKAIARKHAKRNDDLYDELYQEGLIALSRLDPAKATDNPDSYIRQSVKFRMIDYIRRERANRTESLNAHLERGQQVSLDEHGEPHLIAFKLPNRLPLYEEDSRWAYVVERSGEEEDQDREI